MIIYLQIPVVDDNPIFMKEAYALDYLATTGEGWVMMNMEEQTGIRMMMGSSRCTEAQAAELKTRWPMMTYKVTNNHVLPAGWIEKVVE